MHRSSSLPALVIACTAFGGLPAQAHLSLPLHADIVDGQFRAGLPFGVPGFRTQILVDAAAIAPNGALLNGIAFRTERSTGEMPEVVPNVTIELSQTSVAVGTMSPTFAINTTGPTTTVFQGTVNLPGTLPGFAGAPPWNIIITFPTPFLFTTAAGNLLIDIKGNNPTGGIGVYTLDAVQGGGAVSVLGASGIEPLESLELRALTSLTNFEMDPRGYAPGNTIAFTSFRAVSASPGLLALGTAPQPFPIDLTPLGAPTNFIYIDPLVMAAHTWSSISPGFSSVFPLAVPNNPLLIGVMLYGQSLVFAPAANALGVVLSNAVEVRIGDPAEQLPLQQCDADDPLAPTGYLLDFGPVLGPPEYGSVPIRFDGTFF